jgi:histidinol dehydrogenase
MVAIKRFSSTDADFKAQLDALLAFEGAQDEKIDQTVAAILADVKARGDAAVIEYTNRFDRLSAKSMTELELSRAELEAAGLAVRGGRRHAARPEDHPARPRRPLRAGRQGGLPVVGADERDSGPRCRRQRTDHGRADAGR